MSLSAINQFQCSCEFFRIITEGRKYPYRWSRSLKIRWKRSCRTKTLQAGYQTVRLSLALRVRWTAQVLKTPWCPAPAHLLLLFEHWGATTARDFSPQWGAAGLQGRTQETTVSILQMSVFTPGSCGSKRKCLHDVLVFCVFVEDVMIRCSCLKALVIRASHSWVCTLMRPVRSSLAVVRWVGA